MATLPDNNASPRLALVAVSNPAMRTLCRETLQDIGFTVANGLESGTAVITGARERHPDVIILSEQLSDVPASEVVKWLRSNRTSATSPIIVLGRVADTLRDDLRLTVMPRPITRTRLRKALTQAVGITKAHAATTAIDATPLNGGQNALSPRTR